MAKVTGIGGVFFKCDDKDATLKWYRDKLGIEADQYGFPFLWRELGDASRRGYTVWSPFARDTKYFDPSGQPFMVNFRVEGIEALIDKLRAAGVEVVGDIEQHENGKFAWVVDPAGTKLELWEPVDPGADPYLPDE